ncbi:MAG: T9SS type A sorting domain-containing protein [Sphingobacteriales bacterium]|nr:MAG: T9SS type A sorting domain-containing protein [Sphingobacteriales bacterium]
MKKLVLLFITLIGLGSAASAQKYTVQDTIRHTVWGDSWKMHNNVMNVSTVPNDSVTLTWSVTANDFPTSWKNPAYTGICDNEYCRNGMPTGMYTARKFAPNTKMDFYLQFNPEDFTENGTHYVTVEFTDGTTIRHTTFIVTKQPTSVNNVSKQNDGISMYPNPASNELNVIFEANSNIKNLAVYNLIGKPVMVYKVTDNNSAKLNIESIPSGVYFLRFIDAQGRVSAIRKFTHY